MKIEEIVENQFEMTVIEKIKFSELPLFIWGKGNVGQAVLRYLSKNNIDIEGVFVDNEYYEDNEYLESKKIMSFADVLNQYPQFNIVLGHCFYDKGELIKEKYENIANVFYITSIIYNQYNRIPYEHFYAIKEKYQKTYDLLEDERSKECLISYLNARINDDVTYLFKSYAGVMSYFKNEIYSIQKEEVFLDVGAYIGDTVEEFIKECQGNYKFIYAFEAHGGNYSKLKEYVEKGGNDSINLFHIALGKEKGRSSFCDNEEESGISTEAFEGEEKVSQDVVSLDELYVKNNLTEKITLFKINFFVGTIEVLMGAKKVISDMQPKMAITCGFDEYSIITIPQYIKENWPNYKIYLRFNQPMPARLVLYAVPS